MAERGQPPVRRIAKLNIAALARMYGDKSIETLAKGLDDPDMRIAIEAASKLLDRGYGKPSQTINSEKSADQMTDAELINAIRETIAAGVVEEGEPTGLLN